MRNLGIALVLATLALAASPASADGNHPQSHHSASPCHATGHEHDAVHSVRDHLALADMHHHLHRHLGSAHAESHTFAAATDWSRDWELRWIDYHGAEGHVRLYHAMHKHDSRQRYTMVSDPRHPHERSWHPVR